MQIMLDIDGTLCANGALALLNEQLGTRVRPEEISTPWITSHFGLPLDEGFTWWEKHQQEIYARSEPLPGAIETVRRLATRHRVCIVTARDAGAEAVTLDWLKRYDVPYEGFYIGAEDKLTVCREENLDVVIEDSPEQVAELSTQLPIVLIDQPYNRELAGPRIFRATAWSQVPSLLQDGMRKQAGGGVA